MVDQGLQRVAEWVLGVTRLCEPGGTNVRFSGAGEDPTPVEADRLRFCRLSLHPAGSAALRALLPHEVFGCASPGTEAKKKRCHPRRLALRCCFCRPIPG